MDEGPIANYRIYEGIRGDGQFSDCGGQCRVSDGEGEKVPGGEDEDVCRGGRGDRGWNGLAVQDGAVPEETPGNDGPHRLAVDMGFLVVRVGLVHMAVVLESLPSGEKYADLTSRLTVVA